MALPLESPLALCSSAALAATAEQRVRRAVAEHSRFVWRSLVRLGVPEADAEDAAQEVFLVFARRIGDIAAGSERAFLFGTAAGVASTKRRGLRRRPERLELGFDAEPSLAPGPERLTAQRRLRETLSRLLDGLGADQRAVFVLVELEGMSAPEVSRLLDVPLGTVASRLRRARQAFSEAAKRLEQTGALGDRHDG